MKKQLFIMLALMLIISVNSIAQTFSYNGINYGVVDSSYNSKVYVVGGNNSITGNIIIPDTVINESSTQYQVIGISDYAFSFNYIFDSITIPNTVTYIGSSSFIGCTELKYVHLPNNLDTIKEGTFYSCTSLNTINIDSNIQYIGNAAFGLCNSLINIQLPANGTISDSAFFYCDSLTNVTFYVSNNTKSDDTLYLNSAAFSNCTSLSNIYSKTNIPPIINTNDVFDGIVTSNVNLHVCDTIVYGNSDWSSFNIQYDTTICHSLSLADIENDINLSVYPNPTIDYIDIMVNNNDKSLAYFYDINGKKIKSFSFRGYYRLDTSDLNNGIYLLKIGNATKKIVK